MDFDRIRAGWTVSILLTGLAALFMAIWFFAFFDVDGAAIIGMVVAYLAIGVGAGFGLHLWASGRARHVVSTSAGVVEQSGAELAKQASLSLELPMGISAAQGRVLIAGKLDRTATQALVAESAARGALYAERVKKFVSVAPGSEFGALSELDGARLQTLLGTGPVPLALRKRTNPLLRAVDAITDSYAPEMLHTNFWTWGNPAGGEVKKISRFVWAGVWALLIIGFIVCFYGQTAYIVGGALMMAGFGIGVVYSFRAKGELPGLSADGAQRAIELRSLQLGLRKISDEQIEALRGTGQLGIYAAWAVALKAPKCVQRINKLAKKNPDDNALAHASAVSLLSQPPATFALGVLDPLVNVVFVAALPISVLIWLRRYRIRNRPLYSMPQQPFSAPARNVSQP